MTMDSVRQATPADLPAIREIVTAAYSGYLDRMDRPPAPMLADYGAAVHPAAQGTGIGRQLMDFAERRASLLGLSRLSLYTNEAMTENQANYARLGYREISRHAEDGYQRVY